MFICIAKNKHRIAFWKASHHVYITLSSQNNLNLIAFFAMDLNFKSHFSDFTHRITTSPNCDVCNIANWNIAKWNFIHRIFLHCIANVSCRISAMLLVFSVPVTYNKHLYLSFFVKVGSPLNNFSKKLTLHELEQN